MSADAARQAISRKDSTAALTAIDQAIGFSDKLGARAMAPIYTELSSVSIIGPVAAAKADADAGSDAAKPPAVKAVATGFSRIVLDANLARARLLAAKAEVQKGDLARADADLRAIQGGVLLETVSANLPLVRARENLEFAKASLKAGKTAAAKSQLQAAQRALGDFSKLVPGSPHAAEVQTMIKQMSDALGAPGEAAVSGTQLDQWWNQVADWTDQA